MKRSHLGSSAILRGFAACCAALLVSPAALAQQGGASARQPQAQYAQAPQGAEPMVARLSLRINQLEAEVRRLTGQNEELAHRLRQLTEQFEKVTGDQDLRLRALEGAGVAAPPAGGNAAVAPPAAASGPDAGPPPATAVPGGDKGAKVLGTVRPPGAAGEGSAQAGETPEQLYDRAYALLAKQRDYAAAEQVLRTFIESNPDHALTPNAHYWLGRTYFVRNDFENAAFAFAEGFQKFPKSDKAAANLLNLGMSLSRLGKTQEACTTYTRLLRTYATAEDSIKRRVAREREQAKCRQR